jgi:vancomycin resistance protein YoaR
VADAERVEELLRDLDAEVTAPLQALYRWRQDAAVLEAESAPAQRLDVPAAASLLGAGIARGEKTLTLPVVEEKAPAPPAGLTFPDVLAEGRTYFGDSSRDRWQNVALGLARINDAVVPPGGLFSFNQASGPVTLATGFRPGYGVAISNGRVTTVPSIGGGICQVATTLFHAVFRAGLPVLERNWHLYWMPRYGQPPSGLVGLDATVDDQVGLDFTFVNRTDGWLRVEAVAEGGQAIVRLRGVMPTWRVTIDEPIVTDIVPASHAVIQRFDYSLPRGTRVFIEHAEDGKTVAIRRTVHHAEGHLLEEKVFTAQYAPASNVVLVGLR